MHSDFEYVASLENLFLAWREFRRGKRRKRDVQEFEFDLEDNIFRLHEELAQKTYEHSPYQSFYVQDPKLRHIHKASVRDRVVHQALFRILYPIFDNGFIYDSYSCRVDKGTHRGVSRLETFARKLSKNYRAPVYALKCDIRKFFDSVDQNILLALIGRKIGDSDTRWLIGKIVGSFSKSPGRGLPLGNVTSQLFANVYLNELDQFVKHRLKARHYLRYCDDFIILGRSERELHAMAAPIGEFLERELRLVLHERKVAVRKLSKGIDFLGYVVLPHYRVLRTKTRRRMFGKISQRNLQSYLGVLSHCRGHKIEEQIIMKMRSAERLKNS